MVRIPAGWTQDGPTHPSTPLALQVGLQLSNLDQLDSKLMAVSDPESPQYGEHLDRDAVDAIFAPSAQAGEAVLNWLKSKNITGATSDNHWISFNTDVATANSLLGADFLTFTDSYGNTKIRTTQYQIPDDLAEHIDIVTPTIYLGSVKANAAILKRNTLAHENTNCSKVLTPSCLRDMYNVGNYTPDASCGSRIGFGAFLNESATYSDFNIFQDTFGIPRYNFSVETFNGGINDQSGTTEIESSLDSQYILAMAHPLPVVELVGNGTSYAIPNLIQPVPENFNEPWVPYFSYLLGRNNAQLPQVISNSYGDGEEIVPVKYARRVCNMIGLLGLRGITVLQSSGDSGVGAACKTNDGRNITRFEPQFPSSCPYATSVGGTQAYPVEKAWTGSGGGFSNYFTQPYYQRDAVHGYLDKHISRATLEYYTPFFNASNRAYPDVAAHSAAPGLSVTLHGKQQEVGGTSASAPVFAGLVGMLNDARIRAGKPTLGFMNPWLYTVGKDGLKDITIGYSYGCDGVDQQSGDPVVGGGIIPYARWNATKDWDPVTGWGVPDFQKLLKLVLRS